MIISGGAQLGNGVIITSYDLPRYLRSWGQGAYGVLGNGSQADTSSPGTTTGGGTTWSQVAGAGHMSAAVKTDGTLWTWGGPNDQGQLGNGSTNLRSSPGTTAGGGTTWSQVATGDNHMAAIKTDGTLWTWGQGVQGIQGNGTSTDSSSPGTVAGGGTNWQQVAAGYQHTAAIKSDGTLWTCGYHMLLGTGSTITRSSFVTTAGGGTTWSQVTATGYHTAAVKTDGTLWTWGLNTNGALGDGTATNRNSPVTVSGGGTTWSSVACGHKKMAAVKTDGTMWTWGQNDYGQLGNGTTVNRSSPGTVAGGGTTWRSVGPSWFHTAAIKTDGTLWTCGRNNFGQLGNGSTVDTSSFAAIGGGTTWLQVSGQSGVVAISN